MWRSASRHMKSSFSFSRFGVSSRLSSERASVWLRRIHRDHVLEHRDLGAVLLELRADVVALGRERHRRERARHGDAGRVVLGVLVDGVGRLPAGDGQHAVVDRAAHRVLGAQVVEVGVRVGDERRVGEVVDRVEVSGHLLRPSSKPVR